MFPKLVYQHQNWPSPCTWRDLYCTTWVKPFLPNVHSDQLICLLVLNVKTSATKVTGVSFGTLRHYMLQNVKMMSVSIRSWKPQLSYKWDDYFPSFLIFKACVSYYFTFHQTKALKKLWKMLFVSPKLLFWFLQYSNLRRKLGSWKWKNYDII